MSPRLGVKNVSLPQAGCQRTQCKDIPEAVITGMAEGCEHRAKLTVGVLSEGATFTI